MLEWINRGDVNRQHSSGFHSRHFWEKWSIFTVTCFLKHFWIAGAGGFINLWALTPQNGQTHSNNSLAFSDELFECVWPFCGVGA